MPTTVESFDPVVASFVESNAGALYIGPHISPAGFDALTRPLGDFDGLSWTEYSVSILIMNRRARTYSDCALRSFLLTLRLCLGMAAMCCGMFDFRIDGSAQQERKPCYIKPDQQDNHRSQ